MNFSSYIDSQRYLTAFMLIAHEKKKYLTALLLKLFLKLFKISKNRVYRLIENFFLINIPLKVEIRSDVS